MTSKRTATHRASGSSPTINNRNRHGFCVLEGVPPAEVTTKPVPVVKTELTCQQRAAIEAFGQFVVTIEEAFPHKVADTSTAAKRITRSGGLQMADRVVHKPHEFLRSVIDRTAKSLRIRDGEKPQTAR